MLHVHVHKLAPLRSLRSVENLVPRQISPPCSFDRERRRWAAVAASAVAANMLASKESSASSSLFPRSHRRSSCRPPKESSA